MLQTLLSRIGWFFVLLLLQTMIFNHVHIFGYATPLPYIYFLLILPSATPRWLYILSGFLLGLLIDLFTNTPGMAAFTTCLSGLIIPLLLRLFSPSDSDDGFEPSHRSMEWSSFLKFTISAVFLHCLTFFTIEAFAFFDWATLLIQVGGSSLLTTLIVVAMELVRTK